MEETVVLFQVFSTLASCSQKIKLTVKPLSQMAITTTSSKSKKYQHYHNLLGLAFTMMGQQSMVVTTEKLKCWRGKLFLFTLERQFQIFTLNFNCKLSCSRFPSF